MTESKRIVCLANSRKLAGRCIAGREWSEAREAGRWIRPVSARDGREVSEYERQYEDGSDPRVLDIVNVPVLEPLPENCKRRTGCSTPDTTGGRRERIRGSIFRASWIPSRRSGSTGTAPGTGVNDKIPLELMGSISDSLRLIHVGRLELDVFRPGEAFGSSKRRVQGRFSHAGRDYALWVTDPGYEREYLAKLDGAYEIGGCYLTVSLGEPYGGACYKLIAAIIECD